VRVFEGHAFIVEAAVSIGGRDIKPGINVYRFANRIPLLFEGGSDVITRTATKRINWSSYKINQQTDKVGCCCTNHITLTASTA
jgi:DNA topoisomerase VI subunit B